MRVISSKYGGLILLRGGEGVGERRVAMSGWWRDNCKLYVGKEGVGMREEIKRMVGNGKYTKF